MDTKIVMAYKLKKILKFVALFSIIILLSLLVYEYFRIKPSNVRFSNITSNSVTVSWNTERPISASAIVVSSGDKLPFLIVPFKKERFYDTKDMAQAELEATFITQQNISSDSDFSLSYDNIQTEAIVTERGKYYTHHVEIKGLDPEVEYSFLVGDSIFFKKVTDINGSDIAKTESIPDSILTPIAAYGSVYNANNNSEDIPLSELDIVTDGIVYFNFVDNNSGEKSKTFSSPLNEAGNWYIDISNTTDSNGEQFLEKYKGTDGDVALEINLNVGPLGIWKRITKEIVYSPTVPIVINTPDVQNESDIPGVIQKIVSSSNSLVLGAVASDYVVGQCYFANWCGPCIEWVSDSIGWGPLGGCKCNEALLTARQCSGYIKPEDLSCVGGKVGDHTVVGSVCRICAVFSQNGYDYAKWTDDPDWEVVGGKCERKETIPTITNNQKCSVSTCQCNLAGGYTVSKDQYCTDKLRSPISSGKCPDRDGCLCLETESYISYDAACISGGGGTDGVRTPISSGTACSDLDGCICLVDASEIANGALCRSITSIKDSIANNAKCYDLDGCICTVSGVPKDVPYNGWCSDLIKATIGSGITCTDYDGCKCSTGDEIIKTAKCPEDIPSNLETCWESSGSSLVRSDGSSAQKCDENVWKDSSTGVAKSCQDFIAGKPSSCPVGNNFCFNSNNGKTYFCASAFQKTWEDISNRPTIPPINEVIATELPVIDSGKKCTGEELPEGNGACACKSGYDATADIGDYCRDVYDNRGCMGAWDEGGKASVIGLVCKRNGKTCEGKYREDDCHGDPPSSMLFNDNENISLISKFQSSKVLAETTYNQYIVDQQMGIFVDIPQGVYIFEYNGKQYTFSINDNNESVQIYIDTNGNGKYDKDTDILVSDIASKIIIISLEQKYTFNLYEGFNFVSFPFLIANPDVRTAASLLQKLNEVYGDSIYSISKYDGSWKMVGQNTQVYDNDDFQLIPGQGYIIKSKRNFSISIIGQPVKFDSESDKAPITLFKGWNLIGLYGSKTQQYTAKSLIKGINDFKQVDFTVDNVSKWQSDTQKYDGFQVVNESGIDIEYGFDFPINLLQSYFVRVQDGSGNWQPEYIK